MGSAAYGFGRATFHGFDAQINFFIRDRLLADVGAGQFVVSGEKLRCRAAALVTVNAGGVHEEPAFDVLGDAVGDVSHKDEVGLRTENPTLNLLREMH